MGLGAGKKKCCWWAKYPSLAFSSAVAELGKITPTKGIRSTLPLIHPGSHLTRCCPRCLQLGSLPLGLLALTLAALMLALLTLLCLPLAVLFRPLLRRVGLNASKSATSSLARTGPRIYPLSPSSSLTSSPCSR